ncbi:16S rRNA (cytosine(1407)-C(5))-methyltransferase RsmF [Erwinia pyrifoliae]|uniref:Ribosomal RNA small subunit methyltransferase F n=1 Tax=Erwinia pyrifoliae TaxID=79967 RepID=A0ABY5XBZ3_ERWPY|nr:16S rRNA (cytosine(1407)-C(5))-methyltransferase RsmF [Erwinia pyrifoliae]AUX72915.1 16S rRNA (cytosine(1407)-C(5))-methyltransferase RsmF [Erwinia pyrifoliae]MCA8876813.1 16S rRNA (cytosine(1407)-C(5))-methyltransferase RsmF [Erwinia pyrifoliae]MCT2386971.1 16S rRNA (cytosine(1407)-C(5))-methyltransferase RsmF [Erwinia pyrifoliae]MCU8587430.1 16S rRNA (cytosine(1407)-C(5))-methyltransferase RsmF [Erwinia pyrifoliae]UWS31277.1 16S rRNA (cytosine(1407)-C(5))-methyltransferase RsmF [Erwinia p
MSHTSRVFFPPAFLAQMQRLLPDASEFSRFIAISQQPLRRSLRVNTLKISVDDFLRLVEPYQWALTPIPWCPEGFWISRDDADKLPLGSTAEHLAGLLYIQEASSMLPVSALFAGGHMPQRVMDMAAAPGSKTTQIAACMGDRGAILANEYSASRVKVLHANLSRCGVSNTAMTHFDGRVFGSALPECFDAVLLDAPCSGEGVVRKDADALRNWSETSTAEIAATQRDLINSAFHALRPGGTLVYSTCTLNLSENQQVIRWLLEQYPDAVEIEPLDTLFNGAEQVATAEGFLHVFPHIFDSEGFFVARLRKVASVTKMPQPTYKVGKPPFSPVSRQQQQEVNDAAAKVGLRWGPELKLWQRDKEIWLFPAEIEPLLGRVRFSRIGLKLAETFTKGYRWQHHAAVALADASSANAFELDSHQAEEWYRGRDIYPERSLPGDELIICHQKQPVGIAKKVGRRIKNTYPRELVRDGKLFSV